MKKVCAFIGHSMFVKCRLNINDLTNTIEKLIKNGVTTFLVGTHGEFDEMSLSACCSLKDKYPNITICKVCTNLHTIIKDKNLNNKIETISYPIEEYHFKQRITKSNQIMIERCNYLICFVDTTSCNSGALKTLNYAKRCNKNIINLYKNQNKP